MWKVALIIAFYFASGYANECVPFKVGDIVVACVCNATYCDNAPLRGNDELRKGVSYWYVTDKQGLRMKESEQKFGSCEYASNATLTIDSRVQYQKIMGFGGAFTDSSGLNIKSLSPKTQDELLRIVVLQVLDTAFSRDDNWQYNNVQSVTLILAPRENCDDEKYSYTVVSYYDPKVGSRYTLARVPIGGCDFSTRYYSYDDVKNDDTLKHFALANEDHDYKIPFLRKALELNPEVKVFGAAWSAPGWMKTNGNYNGFGYLKRKYYQSYAQYLTKFVKEYKRNGVKIWALSTGNEPNIAFLINETVITMGWTPKTMAEWVGSYLGPTLAAAGHGDTEVLALDDDRNVLPEYVQPIFRSRRSSKYTTGTAVHFYFDNKAPITVLDDLHNEFPDKFILMTEASLGPAIWGTPDVFSTSWDHGRQYIENIIKHMNHWTTGWVDWNLVLNPDGGPFLLLELSAAIIVDSEKDQFYKLPMYYAMAHFSKFVDVNSVRISITETDTIKATAFLTPSNRVVVVLYNSIDSVQQITLKDVNKGDNLCLELSPYSMNTLIYV